MGVGERALYLAGLPAPAFPIAAALARAVEAAAPELQSRVSYRMLMYTAGRDRTNWVCAVGVTKSAVCLRFLFGAFLADPLHLLRPGTSTLSTIDYPFADQVDEAVVAAYVREAVAGHAEFKQRAEVFRARAKRS